MAGQGRAARCLDPLQAVWDALADGPSQVQSRQYAQELRQHFDRMVVLGMGGSALGTRALLPFGGEGVEVLDTTEPAVVEALLRSLDPARTCFNVVSKSGGTLETASLLTRVLRWFEDGGRSPWKHLVFTTDPEQGALRELAHERKVMSLAIPPGVGGRWSVLTPVGLLPAAFAGVDVDAVVEGARGCLAHQPDAPLEEAITFLAHGLSQGRRVIGFWSYTQAALPALDWWRQLLSESLGRSSPVRAGLWPYPLIGPGDQHSVLQGILDGPDDMQVFVLDLQPQGMEKGDLSRVHHALKEGTLQAIAARGIPLFRAEIKAWTPQALGDFFVRWFAITVGLAQTLGLDPFGQPAVELGKNAARAILEEG